MKLCRAWLVVAPLALVATGGVQGGNSVVSQRCLTATARLTISQGAIADHGSGTLVARNRDRGIIATCAHLFRDTEGRLPVQVELFIDGERHILNGKCLGYDMESDTAVVGVTGLPKIEPVPLASPDYLPSPGQALFAAGCDLAQRPTIRATKMTALNRFSGTPNIAVDAIPQQGRSGGGIFTTDGRLVGVCSTMNPIEGEGIYPASPHFARFDKQSSQWLEETESSTAVNSISAACSPVQPASADLPPGQEEVEVILIVTRKTKDGEVREMRTIPRASAELLRLIEREKTAGKGAQFR